jgi:serine/threonine protein kinase/tetratricopeptide (TPR) repeat protein
MIGQTLSHYRVVERIGAGGMGVVYRAHDEQLDRDVAIKVLPPGSLADEMASKRFRKEALSLARLNHPNVATVHEFGSQDGADFLVTEYIAGTTLDIRLLKGPITGTELIRLGVQLAEGLSAAHQQGIVHRDLKPANLRLTTDGRLKILDFGLAQFMPHPSELGLTLTMTTSQEITGTLPYMAPEQLGGEIADARSDIWSAGAVLYEMATGRRPFQQKTPALLINAILNQVVDAPSKINPEVTPALEAVILKALAKDPAQRYQSARVLAADLESLLTPTSKVFPVTPAKGIPAWMVGAIVAVLLLAFGAYFFTHKNKHVTSTANHRRSIAVLGFRNLSGNPEKSWLSTALSEMLTTELSEGDQLRTIPGESVAQMKLSLALPDADSFSQQTLDRIRQNLGSDNIVLGSYLPLGNGLLRLDLRLQDAIAGETLASVSEKGNESEIDLLVSKAGAALRAKLGIGALSDAQSALVRASLPSNPEAARLYSEGLQKLRLFDDLSARDLLEKAAVLAPDYAPTHSALAEAWLALGYENKAKEQAKRALDLSSKFSREEKLMIEGRAHEVLAERPQAVDSYRALWQFFPDRVDYGLSLIRTQIAAGHGSEAEATLAQLRKLTLTGADVARVDLAEATIAQSQSDFKRQAAASEKAASEARAIGANLLAGQALYVGAEANEHMGESEKSVKIATDARALFTSAGYPLAAARTLLMSGDVLFDKGDYEGARKLFEQAGAVFQEIGAGRSLRASHERIGNVLYAEGKLRESEAYYNRALEFDRTIHDPTSLASDYGNMANALDGLGELKNSLTMQQQALNAFNETGDRRGAAATLNNLGNLAVEMGNLDEARKNYDASLVMTREINYRTGEPYPIAGLGDAFLAGGDVAGAKKQYAQALALCEELKDEDFTAQIQSGMSFLALHEKRYSDGADLARKSAAGFEKANASGNSAWAHALLARNLLAAGKLPEARTAVAQATTLLQQPAGQTPRFEVALASSRVKAKSGKTAEARQELEASIASARKFGYRLYELQARLALGEIELWAGSAGAQSQLAAVEKDARAIGALLVAGEAQELQKK